MKLFFFNKPAAALLLGFAMVAVTASAAEANTERVLQEVEPTAAPTPHMMMPSHSDHDSHDGHDDETASPTTPDDVSAEGDGAAALGGAKTLVAAVGCALAAVGGALSVL